MEERCPAARFLSKSRDFGKRHCFVGCFFFLPLLNVDSERKEMGALRDGTVRAGVRFPFACTAGLGVGLAPTGWVPAWHAQVDV